MSSVYKKQIDNIKYEKQCNYIAKKIEAIWRYSDLPEQSVYEQHKCFWHRKPKKVVSNTTTRKCFGKFIIEYTYTEIGFIVISCKKLFYKGNWILTSTGGRTNWEDYAPPSKKIREAFNEIEKYYYK
jgi:hypothetical protein